MLKAVLAAATALAIAGSTAAYAQQRDGRGDGARRFQPTMDDIRAFQAARVAALRAGLVLTAEQERHWPAFEQAMRDLQQLRLNRINALREAGRDGRPAVTDPTERMRRRAARLSESGAALKKFADATDPLYRSLDDAQKRRFAILSRMGEPRGFRGQRWRDGGEPGTQRGQRRTDAVPAPGTPFGSKTISNESIDGMPAGGVYRSTIGFGGKFAAGEPIVLGGKFNAGAPTVGGKLMKGPTVLPGFGRKTIAPESI